MPQPKRQSSSRSRSGSSKSTASRASAARKTAQQRKAATGRTKAAPKRRAPARPSPKRTTQSEDMRASLQGALELLTQGIVITRDRLQEVLDDAVGRGRMTRDDANTVAAEVFSRGRKQAEAVRSDLEQLLGRAGDLQKKATSARKRGVPDRALREVDKARRAAGLGRFPILNYEDLTAAQITERLGDLSPAELRKVRDHERRNANRKSVLNAIEKALA
jgi:polyhydroxyalkanoate synthesis regulator phasin